MVTMANIKSISRKPNVVSISRMNISPLQQVRFHNRQAQLNLRKNNIAGYRFHTREAVKLNSRIVLSRMRAKK